MKNYKTIVGEAEGLVYGAREDSYDHPIKDFTRTVGMINALFAHKLSKPLTPQDFGLIMICCKLSREAHKSKRDNLVDIAGYAETVGRILYEFDKSVLQEGVDPVAASCHQDESEETFKRRLSALFKSWKERRGGEL